MTEAMASAAPVGGAVRDAARVLIRTRVSTAQARVCATTSAR
jgi:hypothetical protein